jgi:CubicO group peptidase (beta-lactamase class C family)
MNRTLKLALLLGMSSMCHACLTDPDLKVGYEGYEPETLNDGWEISTPEAEDMDREALERVFRDLFREDRYPTVRALLVVRHGRLVAEAYARDPGDRDRIHNVQSVAKTVTSLLAGIALDEGLLPSVDEPLYGLMPQHFDGDPRKRSLTLRHALTQQTGLDFYNPEDTGPFMYSKGSSLANVLHRPLVFDPGTDFYYSDGNPQLVSGAIQIGSGMSMEAFAAQRLFRPLGIERWRWEHHSDGVTFGANGLWLRPRDMARIGQLALEGGMWRGRRIVSSAWLEESTRIHADGDYGFYWWVYQEGRLIAARGAGGQAIVIAPELDLVVVETSDPGAHSWELTPEFPDLLNGVLQAVR